MARRGINMFGMIFITLIIISQIYDLSYAQQCTQTCTQTGFARLDGQYDTVLEFTNDRKLKTILAILTIWMEEEKDLLVMMQMTFPQFLLKLNAMLTWVDTGTKHNNQDILMPFIIPRYKILKVFNNHFYLLPLDT